MSEFKLGKFLLKILPSLISIGLGVVVFFFYYSFQLNQHIAGILNEISGALISVPIIFICYELMSAFSNRKLKDIMGKYARINIDDKCQNLTKTLARDLNVQNFDEYLFINKAKLKNIITKANLNVDELQQNYDDFNKTLRNRSIYEHIDPEQLHNIFRLNNNISYLIYEIKQNDINNIAFKLEKISGYLNNWFDYSQENNLYK